MTCEHGWLISQSIFGPMCPDCAKQQEKRLLDAIRALELDACVLASEEKQ